MGMIKICFCRRSLNSTPEKKPYKKKRKFSRPNINVIISKEDPFSPSVMEGQAAALKGIKFNLQSQVTEKM